MGATSTSIIAEIFLKHTEYAHMAHLTHKHNIINYFRYMDDILLILDPKRTDIQVILKDFNALHPNLQFTAEVERDNTLNCLDISMHRTHNGLKTSIHRKPTFMYSIIPYTSNHPTQHKYGAVTFCFNGLNSCGLQENEYQQDLNVIHNILYNYSFPIKPQKQTAHTKTRQQTTQTSKSKLAAFTYVGKEMSYIKNIFKQTELKIAFWTNHNIGNLLRHKNPTSDKFSLLGMYKLTCPDCNKAYVRQTGRHFFIQYNVHKKAFHKNTHMSSFVQHLHKQAHSFGLIDKMKQVLHHHKKGAHLNTDERFYIHKKGAHLNTVERFYICAEYMTNNHLMTTTPYFPI
jgi:hypothetical protein